MACVFDSGVISGLVGAAIGGACTLWGVHIQQARTERAQQREHERKLRAIVQAMRDEISTLWDIYKMTCGAALEARPAGEPFDVYWPVTQTYMTIFESNADRIGDISDGDLRQTLVRMYCITKSHIDSFRMNNILFERLQTAQERARQEISLANSVAVNTAYKGMAEYRTKSLDVSHAVLQGLVTDALKRMDAFLANE
ncbi:hypothetical protein [Pandoraea sputorum]